MGIYCVVKGLRKPVSDQLSWRVDRLRELREKRGWSQRELGRISGAGQTMVTKYERGENEPSGTAVRLLAEALGVSADYLLGMTDDPRPKIVDDANMSEDERAVLEAFRRESWRGLVRLVADRMPE